MTVNELRLGNYVKYNGELCIIIEISESKITVKRVADSLVITDELFEPIELSSERILKFGFGKGATEGVFIDKNDNQMQLIQTGDLFGIQFSTEKPIEGSVFNTEPIAFIQYLHQFQNLYFDLTGQELTVASNL